MKLSSSEATKIAEETAKLLASHTSKTWVIDTCSFSQVILSCGDVYVQHLLATGSWFAGFKEYDDSITSRYVGSAIMAYEGLKSAVEDYITQLKEIHDNM
ncbi:hypothetical protein P46FS4_91 [Salmonella phage P46FS4]|uniref:Uncharacterized protein n=1 Tax=Salmonella phage P46FS4 TaxID=2712940 RepID=A0A6G6XTV9_9CAUD|nr:hypothetical protein HYQ39_gp091 [Salmonella phage P46FS4]QIG62157.1 hypothetical protein P46FS4_91 [Salmonella phage P46FS4]